MSGVLHGVIASLKAAAAAVTDTYWKYVSLLLNTTSTNGAQNNTFLDSSTNNFTVTRNGDVTQGSFNPYMPTGYWSGYFDGTGDYLTVADNAALQMASGDFTIEFWINFASIANFQTIYDKGYTAAGALLIQTGSGNGTLIVYVAGIATITASSASSVGVWDHYALVRSGTTLTLYKNGTSVGSATNSTNFNSTASLFFAGSTGGGGYYVNGYVSNARVVKGTAVYTANFTPPTTPLTAITNTSLLCLQDNRFKDNSTNNFAITINGDTRISKFAPFSPPASYSTASYGGSGYFDGNGDELNAGSNAAFSFGTGAYTVECWVYLNQAVSASHRPVFVGNNAAGGFLFYNPETVGQLQIVADSGSTVLAANTSLSPNIWNHIVAVRSGTGANQTAIFVNGSRVVNGTDATNWTVTGPLKVGGITLATYYLNGYVSNVRVVKGTAVYDPTQTTLTVPTTPLTAITNTSLLLNFTNAGIYDAATINDGQTVGNAQVSTTQAKFGTTSMALNGTTDYLVTPSKSELQFGTGDFTVEFWWYPSTLATTQPLIYHTNNATVTGTGHYVITYNTSLGMRFYLNAGAAGSISQGATTGWAVNTWYHVAVVRSGATLTIYRDGVSIASGANSATVGAAVPTYIGGEPFDPLYSTGYIDELRITNGYARYTANFTPPTAAFPTL